MEEGASIVVLRSSSNMGPQHVTNQKKAVGKSGKRAPKANFIQCVLAPSRALNRGTWGPCFTKTVIRTARVHRVCWMFHLIGRKSVKDVDTVGMGTEWTALLAAGVRLVDRGVRAHLPDDHRRGAGDHAPAGGQTSGLQGAASAVGEMSSIDDELALAASSPRRLVDTACARV